MKRVLGIAHNTALALLRSRVLLGELLLIILAHVVLGATLSSDGQLANEVRIRLQYIGGTTLGIMLLTTLWISCGQIAEELRLRHLWLVRVKPVNAFEIWFGKWVGIWGCQFVLLLLNAAMLQLSIRTTILRSGASEGERTAVEQQLLSAHRATTPPSLVTRAMIRQEAAGYIDRLAPDTTYERAAVEATVRRELLAKAATVRSGHSRTWPLPATVLSHSRKGPLLVKYRITMSPFDRRPVSGHWRLQGAAASPAIRIPVKELLDGNHTASFPREQITPLLEAGADGLRLTFENGGTEESATIMFDTIVPVTVLSKTGGLLTLTLGAALASACILGLIAAMGLTAGTCFTMPVASLVSLACLLAYVIAHVFDADDLINSPEESVGLAGLLDNSGTMLISGIRAALVPIHEINPVTRLAHGIAITARDLLTLGALCLVGGTGLLGALGARRLSTRELADLS